MDLNTLKRSPFVHVCFAITFFTTGLAVNAVQCVLYLILRPFNKWWYRKINWYLSATLYAHLVFMADWWSGTRVKFYIDRGDFEKYYGKEHGYCIMNHTYEIDWLIGWMLADRVRLLGNCKAYAKKSIQYLPVLGWTWKFSEFVFLERSFDKDKEIINRQIKELSDYPDPIWLLLFPEGTRFTPAKHKISEEFAQQKGFKQLKYHLQPRTKGFIASLQSMRGKVPALYNIQLAFTEDEPVKPTMTSLLLGKSVTGHMYMQRIPMEEVPEGEAELDAYLREMFQLKDKLKDSFVNNNGDYFATSGVPRIEPFELPRRLHPLINIAIWFAIIIFPLAFYLLKQLVYGNYIYFSVLTGFLSIFYFLMNRSIGESKISKGSSYGTNTPKKVQQEK